MAAIFRGTDCLLISALLPGDALGWLKKTGGVDETARQTDRLVSTAYCT